MRYFKKVIEKRDINLMNKELYEFFILHCGFIAHYDINGFKATYSRPRDFAEVFIRHFDSEHPYFDGIYAYHNEPYKETGFTKADIKQEFFRMVDTHKKSISNWADKSQRDERYAAYLKLKNEFDPTEDSLSIYCDACKSNYLLSVIIEDQVYLDFRTVCCVFCGQPIKLQGGDIKCGTNQPWKD